MNQHSVIPGMPAARAPVFFWITIALLGLLFLGGAAGVLLLVFEAKNINNQGGWGWLLVGAVYFLAILIVCFASVICAAVSLFRRERYRRLSFAILIISGLVVLAFGAIFIRGVIDRHQRNVAVALSSASTPQPPAAAPPRSSIPASPDPSSNAGLTLEAENRKILELKSKLWEAIRAKNADAFVDCFFVEERFNTPEIRQENRNQVEILLRGETLDVEVREIPATELVEIAKIQRAKSVSGFRYSLDPRMILRIRQEALNGIIGRSFLIGEKNGKWHIITMAGHTT